MNSIYIVKIQDELINYICSSLTPYIYEGIESIYKDAKQVTEDHPELVLKIFQEFLINIPNWKKEMLETEVKRILLELNISDETLLNILKTIIKYTIHIYSLGNQDIFNDNISVNEFIHDIYKSIAKYLYLNPYLLYDNYSPIELKHNTAFILNIISTKIKDIIFKYIPINDLSKLLVSQELTKIEEQHNDSIKQNLSNTLNISDHLRNIINDEIHKLKEEDSPIKANIPIIPQVSNVNNLQNINKEQNMNGGQNLKKNEKEQSLENVINNDKIEVIELQGGNKLSSSDDIKMIENELKNKLEENKSQTDLIKKLDKDRNEHNGINQIEKNTNYIINDSTTSSDYAMSDNNQIATYSNANSNGSKNVFLNKTNIKTLPKYQNINI
jgi:hypothetical protein